jgi:hypothetical protein
MPVHPIPHVCFTELTPKQHFDKDAAMDEAIHTRFRVQLSVLTTLCA